MSCISLDDNTSRNHSPGRLRKRVCGRGVGHCSGRGEETTSGIEGQNSGGPVFSKIHSEFLQVVVDFSGVAARAVADWLIARRLSHFKRRPTDRPDQLPLYRVTLLILPQSSFTLYSCSVSSLSLGLRTA